MNPQKVFISYSHGTPEHTRLVRQLADALRGRGVDAELDQYHTINRLPALPAREVLSPFIPAEIHLYRPPVCTRPGKMNPVQFDIQN
jgi:hypothetical protein